MHEKKNKQTLKGIFYKEKKTEKFSLPHAYDISREVFKCHRSKQWEMFDCFKGNNLWSEIIMVYLFNLVERSFNFRSFFRPNSN